MQVIESKGNSGEEILGTAESFANLKYWTLTDDDGIKTLKVKFQDYGGNRTSNDTSSFRILFEANDEDIVDVIRQKSNNAVWLAKNGNQPSIYALNPNTSFISFVNEKINCIAIYADILYISVETSDHTALVYRWTGFVLEEAFSMDSVDSEIISMHEFNNKLYLSCKNGSFYSYNESSLSLIKIFDSQLVKVYSDDSLLYLIPRNSRKIFVYDGSKFSEIII
jgi:hypothetical protein